MCLVYPVPFDHRRYRFLTACVITFLYMQTDLCSLPLILFLMFLWILYTYASCAYVLMKMYIHDKMRPYFKHKSKMSYNFRITCTCPLQRIIICPHRLAGKHTYIYYFCIYVCFVCLCVFRRVGLRVYSKSLHTNFCSCQRTFVFTIHV